MSQAGDIDILGTNPNIPTEFITNSGTAVPILNQLEIVGTTVAAGSIPFEFTGLGNVVTGEIQLSQAIAASDVTKVGLAAFDSADFAVDVNGFVTLAATGVAQTLTGNSGVATPVANNINIVTDNSTVKFIGSGDDLTQDFGLANLCLGTSLPSLTIGTFNAYFGNTAGAGTTTGTGNSIFGNGAAPVMSIGTSNCIMGFQTGLAMTGASSCTIIGTAAFRAFTNASGVTARNTGVGESCLFNLQTGSNNLALGASAGNGYTTSESSNIVIGNSGTIADGNTIRIGSQGSGLAQQNRCFVAGITGVTVANTNIVSLDTTTGQLGALSTVPLANGGTNAALTASNGGIFYSTATAGAILAGTATARQMLQSGASTTPAWSTTTWPATTSINRILFSSAANVIGEITTAINGVLVTGTGGIPSVLAAGTAGSILRSGAPAAWSTSTYPATNAINTLLFASSANVMAALPTANNGTLVTNATGVPSILVGPGATGRMFQSTAAAAPAWSTATYPATTTSQQILYSTAANVVGQLTTANSAIAATNAAGTLAMRALSVVIQTFVANGTYTPTTGMLYCIIEIQAPGGGGGGSAATTAGQLAYGSGGGGGEYARGVFSAATVGASQTVTCPAGGAGGTAGANNGTAGATASVGVLITAVGGSAGLGMAATATTGGSVGGNGGSGGTGGSFRLRGGYGTTSAVSFGVITIVGNGGTSSFSQGAQALTTTGTGTTGTGYGGGGGGGQSFVSAAAQAGGAGSSGIVVITEYVIA